MAARFARQTVFITGASSGIGAELARQLAREGARIALAARRVDKLDALVQSIRAEGGEAIAVACDVTDRGSLDGAVAQTVETFGGIDVCIANAGFGVVGAFLNLSTEDYRRQFETNVFGVIDTAYAVLPHLIERKGRLAVVASVSGRLGTPFVSAYCASKFALCGWAEAIDPELRAKGVSVTLINPGFVDSEIRYKNNRGEWREGAKDPAPAWLVVPTDRAARAIVRAVHRRRFEAVITGHGKAIVFFARHFPRTVRALLRLTSRR